MTAPTRREKEIRASLRAVRKDMRERGMMGAAALISFGSFESGMNRVRALTGATGQDFAQLTAQAKELGARAPTPRRVLQLHREMVEGGVGACCLDASRETWAGATTAAETTRRTSMKGGEHGVRVTYKGGRT